MGLLEDVGAAPALQGDTVECRERFRKLMADTSKVKHTEKRRAEFEVREKEKVRKKVEKKDNERKKEDEKRENKEEKRERREPSSSNKEETSRKRQIEENEDVDISIVWGMGS